MSRGTRERFPASLQVFLYGAITLYGMPFQGISSNLQICNSPRGLPPSPKTPHYPRFATPAGFNTNRV